ncbi:MAG TPA: K(+)-transporting ATPase subunit F [Thermoplasmata archaeon]|jgi:K+-transporting ATPase KdpF subunit|nr:K(+)-transporting ATPase subunit F [Thermoplasmata archaeon]
MAVLQALADNLGLTVLTVIAVALSLYLVYAMIHPEKF